MPPRAAPAAGVDAGGRRFRRGACCSDACGSGRFYGGRGSGRRGCFLFCFYYFFFFSCGRTGRWRRKAVKSRDGRDNNNSSSSNAGQPALALRCSVSRRGGLLLSRDPVLGQRSRGLEEGRPDGLGRSRSGSSSSSRGPLFDTGRRQQQHRRRELSFGIGRGRGAALGRRGAGSRPFQGPWTAGSSRQGTRGILLLEAAAAATTWKKRRRRRRRGEQKSSVGERQRARLSAAAGFAGGGGSGGSGAINVSSSSSCSS